jgi:hypothetical protein
MLWIRIILVTLIASASNKNPDPHKRDKLDPEPDPHQFVDDKPNEWIMSLF